MDWKIKTKDKSELIEVCETNVAADPVRIRKGGQDVLVSPHKHFFSLRKMDSKLEQNVRLRNLAQFVSEAGEIEFEGEVVWKSQVTSVRLAAQINVPGAENRTNAAANATVTVRSPMAGKVLKVVVEENQIIKEGDELVVIEAMKMENKLYASRSGKVKRLHVKVGDSVTPQAKVLVISNDE